MSDQTIGESRFLQGESDGVERSRADGGRRDRVLRMSQYHPIVHVARDEDGGWTVIALTDVEADLMTFSGGTSGGTAS